MPIQANSEYNGTIIHAASIFSQSGTPGIQVTLEAEQGTISHTLWLTEKTIKRVESTLVKIGMPKEQLYSDTALENIDQILSGKAVNFTTVSEEYQGKPKVKVQWLNPPKSEMSQSAAKTAAKMFAALGNSKPAGNNQEITDDDVPF